MPKDAQLVGSRATNHSHGFLTHPAVVSCPGGFCIIKFFPDSSSVLGVAQIQTSQNSIVCDYAPVALHFEPASELPGGLVKTDCWVPPWLLLSVHRTTGGAWEFVSVLSSQELLVLLIGDHCCRALRLRWGSLLRLVRMGRSQAVQVGVLALPLTDCTWASKYLNIRVLWYLHCRVLKVEWNSMYCAWSMGPLLQWWWDMFFVLLTLGSSS